uniref:Reverse transcriptase zinc-binding domain-containing protein n=1 Tax=Lactuca sativa TaxID=4236 RepID=A0A9R1VBQ7_LACSA|nr:hypothetical protein LSAT_V11C600328160 [Lactuca sativa]
MWKTKNLSFGGRIKLAKAVLGNLPNYYLTIFTAPTGILEILERIRRNYIWGGGGGGGAPHDVGGLGIRPIKAPNISLLSKWWWKLKTVGLVSKLVTIFSKYLTRLCMVLLGCLHHSNLTG